MDHIFISVGTIQKLIFNDLLWLHIYFMFTLIINFNYIGCYFFFKLIKDLI